MLPGARGWTAARWLVVALFLAACARSYHPGSGFTGLIHFSTESHDLQLPAVQAAPHLEVAGGYDGLYYAQLAVDPLLRDPAIDRALDSPAYRARRILFSWTAYLVGLGRPAWILQVYAVQNIVVWLLLAWVLGRVIPQTSPRAFALWAACLLAHGLIASVALALLDGPSVLLIVLAILATERGWLVRSALVLGAAGLARETNLLGVSLFAGTIDRRPRSWLRALVLVVISAVPLALWLDYLRSIYRWRTLTGGDHIVPPFQGLMWKVGDATRILASDGLTWNTIANIAALAGFLVSAGIVLWMFLKGDRRSPWLLVALSFLVLAIVARSVVWEGFPGAYTRVVLPMTIAVNVLLSRERRPSWFAIATANLGVIAGLLQLLQRLE